MLLLLLLLLLLLSFLQLFVNLFLQRRLRRIFLFWFRFFASDACLLEMLQVAEVDLDHAGGGVQRSHDRRVGRIGLESASVEGHQLVDSSYLLHRFRRELFLNHLRIGHNWTWFRHDWTGFRHNGTWFHSASFLL